ncbi:MAG TPA: HhH-GPD-type base excision DNA repair protein [Acidimicrobiales bacterium]|nr:HhH-GPD-type base excision DNA repair protein [Acidimicrobiales bacterium]
MAGDTFFITGDREADDLLAADPLALLLGMLLDQQVPMEWAFGAPARLRERLAGSLDAGAIAAMDPDDLAAAFREKPALHRYPTSMAKRAHELCRHLVEHHDGRAEAVWEGVADGAELRRRLEALPGFGKDKARIFLAVLAKRRGVRPPGWEDAAGPFADGQPRSVADVTDQTSLERVRAFKKEQKAAGRAKDE